MVRRWGFCIALGLLGCGADRAPEPRPRGASHKPPKLPPRILQDSDECRWCELSDEGVCEMHWRFGCGDATCGAEIGCDPECCRRADGEALAKLKARAETGGFEGFGELVPLGRSFEVDGVLHHRRVAHLVGMFVGDQRGIYWYVEHSYPADNHEPITSAIWRVTTELAPTELFDAVGEITDLELAGEWLLFTQYDAEQQQTSVHRLRAVGGRPELLGSWPGAHSLTRTDAGVRLVIAETDALVDPITKQQAGELELVEPELARCRTNRPGEPPDVRAVHAFDEQHVFWTTPLEPEAWEGLGIGPLGLLRHCHLESGSVETLGLIQLPARDEVWPVYLAWTEPLLAVAFADGVFIDYVERRD